MNSSRKKIFIAINPPENIKDRLISMTRSDGFALLPVRWSDKENLHITLEFLGLVEDDDLYKVVKILYDLKEGISKKLDYTSLEFTKIAIGPTAEEPFFVWAVGPKNESLSEVNKILSGAFSDIRIIRTGKRHSFTPHITLGKIERDESKNFKMKEKEIRLSFPIDSIELMESFKEKNRIRYAVLESIKL